MKFEAGMIVKLKSGGPKMTISGIIGDSENPLNKNLEFSLKVRGANENDIYCIWFDEKNKLEQNFFHPILLTNVIDESDMNVH